MTTQPSPARAGEGCRRRGEGRMTHGLRRGLNDPAATRLKTVRIPYFNANTPHPPAGRSRLCGQVVGRPSAGEGPSGCGW